MTCRGTTGDYLCQGWTARTAKIRERDGNRCRGCNRNQDEVRLEVHHRIYGNPGPCGNCYLTGVHDEDLTTFCSECHDELTDVRRRVRYAIRSIEIEHVLAPAMPQTLIKVRSEVSVEYVIPASPAGKVVNRSLLNTLGED